jgi:hypothetical protein
MWVSTIPAYAFGIYSGGFILRCSNVMMFDVFLPIVKPLGNIFIVLCSSSNVFSALFVVA